MISMGLDIVLLFASYWFGPWLKDPAASFGSKGIGQVLKAIQKNQMNQVLYGKSKFESIKNEFVNLRTEMEFYHTKQISEAAKNHFTQMIALVDQSLSYTNTLTEIMALAVIVGGMAALNALTERSLEINKQLKAYGDE